MKHIVIDLEMNKIARSSEARKICKSEIIEIGAVMLDENLQEIGNFRTYVKPEYNDKIAAEIRNLTGITDAMVANAPVLGKHSGCSQTGAWEPEMRSRSMPGVTLTTTRS